MQPIRIVWVRVFLQWSGKIWTGFVPAGFGRAYAPTPGTVFNVGGNRGRGFGAVSRISEREPTGT